MQVYRKHLGVCSGVYFLAPNSPAKRQGPSRPTLHAPRLQVSHKRHVRVYLKYPYIQDSLYRYTVYIPLSSFSTATVTRRPTNLEPQTGSCGETPQPPTFAHQHVPVRHKTQTANCCPRSCFPHLAPSASRHTYRQTTEIKDQDKTKKKRRHI